MRTHLLILLLFVSLVTACTTGIKDKTITRKQAIEDIDFMVNYIRGTHPDMFANCPEEVFMQKVEEVKASLPKKVRSFDLFRYIGELPPMLGDGHTYMFPAEKLLDPNKDLIFPYTVEINAGDSSFLIVENGKKVASINDIPAKEICGTLAKYASGETTNYRLGSVIQKRFPIYMRLIYPADRYTIVYEGDDTDDVEVADAVPFKTVAKKLHNEKEKSDYSYSIWSDVSACILDFRQFADKEKFTSFLTGMFTEMKSKKVENLIIDLRNNGGGNSTLGDELFQYISPVPFSQFGDVTVRFSENVKKAYPSEVWTDTIVYHKAGSSDLIPLRDNPLRYAGKGNIYVLTSINTFSSATDFSWAFQYFNMGKIIGEETGGHIVCFGDVIGEPLPHSSLRIGSSFKKFYGYGATDDHTHGVFPDYQVPAKEALDFTINKLIKKT